MRQTISIVALLLLTCFAFGQKKRHSEPYSYSPTKAQEKLINKYITCTNLHRYTASQRRAFFPFGQAKNIRLISYKSPGPYLDTVLDGRDYVPIPAEDTIMQNFIPTGINNFKVNYRRVVELKDLSIAGIDSLTDILYNVGNTPVKNLPNFGTMGYNCYVPRNAILFMDAEGKVTQYIEYCFGCERYFYSSSKTKSIDYCEQKLDMLAVFFLSQGVKYGTEKMDNEIKTRSWMILPRVRRIKPR